MKRKIQVQASIVSSARPEEIYPLLENSATYPLWSMIEYFESVRPGPGGIHDVGAIRLFLTGRAVMHEEITVLEPNARVGYYLISGFPMLDYHAETTLEPVESGTRITWKSSFHPKYPLTGWFWRALMGWLFRRMVRLLAAAAENPERRAQILALAQGTTMAKTAVT
jgi:hypothetical protein